MVLNCSRVQNIRINNANDTKDIESYPMLCYLIYYFSCILIQFKIWLFQDMNKSGFHPHIQNIYSSYFSRYY